MAGGGAGRLVNGGAVLNSWKEIATYLGKGVRTVQRWEGDLGLPVHRPVEQNQRMVIAVPNEIDHWVRRQLSSPPRIAGLHKGLAPVHSDRSGELTRFVENVRQVYNRSERLLSTARSRVAAARIRTQSRQLRARAQQTRQRSEQLRSVR